MRRRLQAARPDVVVMFSNDHLLNWPINNTPEYTVGIAAEHVGPADWYDEWLALDKYRVPGHPALARTSSTRERGAASASPISASMQFDDGISVPMHYLNPEHRLPLVPVTMNCTVPPIPTRSAPIRWAGSCATRCAPTRAPSGSPSSPPAASRTSQAARGTSGWTRSSIAGSSTC